MQEWSFAARDDAARHAQNQIPRKSAAPEIRVCAYGRQLSVSLWMQAFARYCSQPSIDANAKEFTHLHGTAIERTRVRQLDERGHFVDIGSAELHDLRIGGRITDGWADHLIEIVALDDLETFDHGEICEREEDRMIAGCQ